MKEKKRTLELGSNNCGGDLSTFRSEEPPRTYLMKKIELRNLEANEARGRRTCENSTANDYDEPATASIYGGGERERTEMKILAENLVKRESGKEGEKSERECRAFRHVSTHFLLMALSQLSSLN